MQPDAQTEIAGPSRAARAAVGHSVLQAACCARLLYKSSLACGDLYSVELMSWKGRHQRC